METVPRPTGGVASDGRPRTGRGPAALALLGLCIAVLCSVPWLVWQLPVYLYLALALGETQWLVVGAALAVISLGTVIGHAVLHVQIIRHAGWSGRTLWLLLLSDALLLGGALLQPDSV